MGIESEEKKIIMTPEEQKQHEEFLRRQRILQESESEKALEETARALEKELTPEEIEKSQKAAKEREETKPWGI